MNMVKLKFYPQKNYMLYEVMSFYDISSIIMKQHISLISYKVIIKKRHFLLKINFQNNLIIHYSAKII